jgi:hypothetical protein
MVFLINTVAKLLSVIITVILSFSFFAKPLNKQPEIVNLGIPTEMVYTKAEHVTARSVWDMAVLDGKLYIGCGDYDKNSGNTTMFAYDIEKDKWTSTGILNDEAIGKFYLHDNKLYAPGFDATTSSWEYGNYHILSDGEWQSIKTLPQAVHNFDIIEYNGNLFFAIGTEKSEISPVKMLSDDGNYVSIPFTKNGENLLYEGKNFNRVYDFFIANDELYCNLLKYGVTQIMEFYKFNGQQFEFVSDDDAISYKVFKQNPTGASATYKGTCYFSVGNFYKTDDFKEFTQIEVPNGAYVTDFIVEKGRFLNRENMYVLTTNQNEDKSYVSTVYRYNQETGFKKLAEVTLDGPAISLAKYKNNFFLGFGKTAKTDAAETAGTVIKIEF